MAFFAGSHGALYLDTRFGGDYQKNTFPSEPVAKVRGWSINQTTETLDVTSLQDTDRNFRPGLRTMSGTADFFYYTSTKSQTFSDFINGSIQTRLPDETPDDNKFDNTAVAVAPQTYGLKLFMSDQNRGADNDPSDPTAKRSYYIQVRCILTSVQLSISTGEVTGGSIGFQVIGAPLKVEA